MKTKYFSTWVRQNCLLQFIKQTVATLPLNLFRGMLVAAQLAKALKNVNFLLINKILILSLYGYWLYSRITMLHNFSVSTHLWYSTWQSCGVFIHSTFCWRSFCLSKSHALIKVFSATEWCLWEMLRQFLVAKVVAEKPFDYARHELADALPFILTCNNQK